MEEKKTDDLYEGYLGSQEYVSKELMLLYKMNNKKKFDFFSTLDIKKWMTEYVDSLINGYLIRIQREIDSKNKFPKECVLAVNYKFSDEIGSSIISGLSEKLKNISRKITLDYANKDGTPLYSENDTSFKIRVIIESISVLHIF